MTLTLHDIKVWNTGEVIDLIVPSDADKTVDASAMTIAAGLIITPVLILGKFGLPRLGIIAPAIAASIGMLIALIFLYVYLNWKDHPLRPNWALMQHIRHQPELSRIILRLGVPTGIQMVTTSAAGLVIVGLVNRYGADATAAYGAVNQVLNYIQFPALSISIAASIFAAQAIGAGKSELLNKVTRTALGMNIAITGTLVALAYLFSKYLMALFITDPQVVALGQQLLFIVLWSILFFGASAIFASIMRASGTVSVPMMINIAAILLIEVDGHPAQVADDAEAVERVLKANHASAVHVPKDAEEKFKLWEARRMALPVLARCRPTTVLEDATVPRSQIPAMLKAVNEIAAKYKLEVGTFGHAGDGNLHIYLCSDDMTDDEFAKKGDIIISELYKTARSVDGNMSGEHGVGYARQNYYEDFYGKDYTDLLRKVKGLFDPKGILNPDKIFPLD